MEFESFYCACREGYRIRNDPYSCPFNDIFCRDTAHGLQCWCRSDGNKPINGTHCEDLNECEINNGGCEQYCYNEVGGYRCGCDEGYRCAGDKHACVDINECLVTQHTDGDCGDCYQMTLGPCGDQDCINTDGSYVCLGRAIDHVNQDGHFKAMTGAESVALVSQPTTAAIIGASVSTMVVTVLLGIGVGMSFRWYDQRKKAAPQ